MGLGLFSATPYRNGVVDFTSPFYKAIITFAAHLPSKLTSETWTISVRSFHSHLWVVIILYLLLTAVAMALSHYYGYPKREPKADLVSILLSAWLQKGKLHRNDFVLFIVLISDGCPNFYFSGRDEPTQSLSIKIVTFTTYVFCWLIVCFYNAVLITYLTLDTSLVMSNLQELTASSYTLGLSNGNSITEILKVQLSTALQDYILKGKKEINYRFIFISTKTTFLNTALTTLSNAC